MACQTIPTFNIAFIEFKLNAKLIKSGHHIHDDEVTYCKINEKQIFDLLRFPLCVFITNYYKF